MTIASTTNEVLATVLTKALQLAEKTGDFVVEQAPDLVRQLLLYKTAEYAVATILGIFMLLGSLRLWVWVLRAASCSFNDDTASPKSWRKRAERLYRLDFEVWGNFPAALLVLPGAALVFANMFDLIQILLAPKVWLLEYAAGLVRGG